MIRESSLNKPATQALRDAGVEVRVGDVTDDIDKLKTVLVGVDILISAVYALLINDQKGIIRAAKELGTVQRVIPCDFGTPGARGVRDLHDMVRPFPSSHHGYQKLSTTLEIRDTRLYRGARRAAHIHRRRLVDAALPPAALTHQGARAIPQHLAPLLQRRPRAHTRHRPPPRRRLGRAHRRRPAHAQPRRHRVGGGAPARRRARDRRALLGRGGVHARAAHSGAYSATAGSVIYP